MFHDTFVRKEQKEEWLGRQPGLLSDQRTAVIIGHAPYEALHMRKAGYTSSKNLTKDLMAHSESLKLSFLHVPKFRKLFSVYKLFVSFCVCSFVLPVGNNEDDYNHDHQK